MNEEIVEALKLSLDVCYEIFESQKIENFPKNLCQCIQQCQAVLDSLQKE